MNSSSPRILIVVNVFRPDLGGGVLFADLCDGLSEKGFEVHVKCAYPYYPQWRDVTGKNGLGISIDNSDGYRVERHGIYIPKRPNSLFQRLLYEASFFLSLARRIPKRSEFAAILVFSPLIGSVAYAALVSALRSVPVWLNVQDLSAQAAAAGGIAGRGQGLGLLERIQNALFRRCHYWSSISEPMVESLQGVKGAPNTVHLVPNWLHASMSRCIAKQKAITGQSVPTDSALRLLYSGNIGGKQHLVEFCRLLHQTRANFAFRIQAEGARLPDLKEWLDAANDPRFELHPLSDEEGLASALAEADFYVITEKPGAGNSFIPSKLIPGISSGTPILAVCDPGGPLGLEISQYDLGYLLNWESLGLVDQIKPTEGIEVPGDLEHFFNTIAPDQALRETWQAQTLARAAFYNRENGIERYARALNEVIALKTSA